MADSEDLNIEELARKLSLTYQGLVLCCEQLPIPVALPRHGATNVEAEPAVRRVAELADDQPMPEEIKAHLFTAAIFWLSGLDVFRVLVMDGWHDARGLQVIGCLVVAQEALSDLGEWLIEQMG
ncbi:hypothetical protein [Streptomyces sp. NPDC052225]|uniref:hypothetical protein n=1 Tax=Streptomyces sp. NPDC052225 TaxID=3154949 RepID=UPI003436E728